MLVCYVLFGAGFGKDFLINIAEFLGSGTSPLLRSYIAQVTSEENRSTAYALQNGAMVLSVIVGPGESEPLCHIRIHLIAVAQISFAGLPYPGVIVFAPHIKLNIYTGEFPWSTCLSFAVTFSSNLVRCSHKYYCYRNNGVST